MDDITLVLQQNRLWWYGHVLRKEDTDWVKKCPEYEVEGSRPRGRPKMTWREVVQNDCQACKLNREDAMDCSRRKKMIEVGSSSKVSGWVGECFFCYRLTWDSVIVTMSYSWGCTAVVCKVVCYMEVRPGLSRKKMRCHFSEQRWECLIWYKGFCFRAASCMSLFTPLFFVLSITYRLQPTCRHGHRHNICQKTWFCPRMCLFGVAKSKVNIYSPFSPKKRPFCCPILTVLRNFRPKKQL